MTSRQHFRALMAERRSVPRHSPEYSYLTRAARKLLWLDRGVPVNDWPE